MRDTTVEKAISPPRVRSRRMPALTGTRAAPWVFIAPFFILLIAFTVAPAIYAAVMSLRSDSTSSFVGLDNYSTVVNDSDFQSSAGVIWQAVYTLAPLFCIVVTV